LRIVVVTRDPTGPELGGNAMRATELARALGAHGDVLLVAPGSGPPAQVAHAAWDPQAPRTLRPLLAGADAVVSTPQSPEATAELRRCGARLVIDLYDPFPLAVLEAHAGSSARRRRLHAMLAGDAFLEGMRAAHHLVCASERQRDLWLGALLAAGLLRPETYDSDPTLRSRIDVVPTGVPSEPPPRGRPLREALAAVGAAGATSAGGGAGAAGATSAGAAGSEIVLWYGGLWNWLDPVTPVRAMPALLERRPDARLVFLGRAPSGAGEHAAADAARVAARELGDRVVFLDAVAPYRKRGAWLTDAACAVSAHAAHLETRFAFRTRMLDFIWAGLPVVCTEGDALSDLVARDGLGEVVAPGDHEGMAEALARVLATGRDAYAAAFAGAAEAFAWPRVTAPLVRMVTAAELPPRLGEAALVPALPGPASRALLTRALRGTARRFTR
jgi:glycosyltransferase involved in cell wall biosynthesis